MEIDKECKTLHDKGFRHILLVTGESGREVGMDYFVKALKIVKKYFHNISMEVQPLGQLDYENLLQQGVHSILVYQETYHQEMYRDYHPKGRKSNFVYRLETPDRIGRAGMHKIGLGCLLGLHDWRTDSFFLALHLHYLERKYWKSRYSVSFPRLRPAEGMKYPEYGIKDKELVQLICALRIFSPETELTLSTRESGDFRNHVMKLGITSMSAGSKTNPGGYTDHESLEQFEVSDHRSVDDVSMMIRNNGYEPVFKDWDTCLSKAQ
jgi:2-iminoacetate synthase